MFFSLLFTNAPATFTTVYATMDQLVFEAPATPHERHWVSDGNVVLCAVSTDKSPASLFRVHKSLLSGHSEVFASMFEIPQCDSENGGRCQVELYEGLPVVRLSDTEEEVCALLDALRNPLYVVMLSSLDLH